ncbi:MAG: DUF554 domain-containing protein [Chloroflexi bacterium]|nr:DUF554 domain-containing protein [Chloroflexota bacterium]
MTGTILNVVTVLIGATIGVLLGARFPERVRQTVMAGLGIMTLIVGVGMALPGNALIILFSLLTGGIIGELLDVDGKLNALGRWLEARFARGEAAGNFTRGFVTASLVFCVGPMTILGSIQDGLIGDYRLLAIKSLLDMFAGLAFASTLGIGVAFAGATVLIVQGGIALLAMFVGSSLGEITRATPWVIQMTATGGAVILGISLLLLDLKKIRVANFIPAILIAPLIQVALEYFRIQLP